MKKLISLLLIIVLALQTNQQIALADTNYYGVNLINNNSLSDWSVNNIGDWDYGYGVLMSRGSTTTIKRASQTIDITEISADVDANKVVVNASIDGLVQNYYTLSTSIEVRAIDASNNSRLIASKVCPKTSGYRKASINPILVPANTRKLVYTIASYDNDPYMCNFLEKPNLTLSINLPPSIGAINDQSAYKNSNANTMPITVSDENLNELSITLSSSNIDLIPNNSSNISVSGTGASRTISLTPNTNQIGTSTITVTATDQFGVSVQKSFLFTVLLRPFKDITSFQFTGLDPTVVGTINNTTKAISVTVPYGTDVEALVPTINITGVSILPTIGITDFTNPVNYVVTAEDGTEQTYTVTVNVLPPSTDNKLSDLTVDGTTISGFDATTLAYYIELPFGTTDIPTVDAVVHDTGIATLSINQASNLPSHATISVTAQNGVENTYTVHFTVALNPAKQMISFSFNKLSPVVTGSIDEANKRITLTVPYGTDVTSLTPTISHTGASILPHTNIVQDYTTAKTYTVTAEDGTHTDYEIVVNTVPPHVDATLSDLTIDGSTVTAFDSADTVYDILLPYGSVVVPNVEATVNDIGAASYVIAPADSLPGSTQIEVTAQDGTTKIYTVNFIVALNSAKSISSFDFNNLSIIGNVDEVAKTVTLTVPYSVDITELTPTILSTGVAVSPTSGVAQDFSRPVTYTITAEDGTTQDYAITVNQELAMQGSLQNVMENSRFNQTITLTTYHTDILDSVATDHITLGKDFDTLSVSHINWISDTVLEITLTGNLEENLGSGTITLDKSVLSKSAKDLSTSIIVNSVVPVSDIQITTWGNASTVQIDKTLQIGATITPNDATDDIIIWSVENGTGTATIDATGMLTATGIGTVTVRANAHDGSGIEGSKEIVITHVPPTPSIPPTPPNNQKQIFVNGLTETVQAEIINRKIGDQRQIHYVIDENSLNQILSKHQNQATELTIPFDNVSDSYTCEMTGTMLQNMQDSNATLQMQTKTISYRLPVGALDLVGINQSVGNDVSLSEVGININIIEATDSQATFIKEIFNSNYTLVVPPIEFNMSYTYNGNTYNVNTFNTFVERRIQIPNGIDPSKISTGAVIEPDGTLRHVPTKIIKENGKYYAVINSLTNSSYIILYNPITFSDVNGLVQESIINQMGSQLILKGIGNNQYDPDRLMTRAEFIAVLIRAFGLSELNDTESIFEDIQGDEWFAGDVMSACEQDIIDKYDKKYRPYDPIVKEEMLLMVNRAIKAANMDTIIKRQDVIDIIDSNNSDQITRANAASITYEIMKLLGLI